MREEVELDEWEAPPQLGGRRPPWRRESGEAKLWCGDSDELVVQNSSGEDRAVAVAVVEC